MFQNLFGLQLALTVKIEGSNTMRLQHQPELTCCCCCLRIIEKCMYSMENKQESNKPDSCWRYGARRVSKGIRTPCRIRLHKRSHHQAAARCNSRCSLQQQHAATACSGSGSSSANSNSGSMKQHAAVGRGVATCMSSSSSSGGSSSSNNNNEVHQLQLMN